MKGPSDPAVAATWARLQTFVTVHETGSVRAAAELLHVTPPAVSGALAALESSLGTPLFEKSGRGIEPTDAGEIFAAYARRLLGLLTEATVAVRAADRGRVRIGAVATASEFVLPQLIASFTTRYPQVEFSLSVLPRDELFGQAMDHGVDVVLAGRPPRASGLVTRARRPNRLVVVGRPGMRDPLDATWLLTAEGSGTRDTSLSLLTRLQAAPRRLTLGSAGAVIAAARQGLGVALLHEPAVRQLLDAGELALYHVPGTPLDRPWHLCTSSRPTAATMLFVRHLCDPQECGEGAFHTGPRPTG